MVSYDSPSKITMARHTGSPGSGKLPLKVYFRCGIPLSISKVHSEIPSRRLNGEFTGFIIPRYVLDIEQSNATKSTITELCSVQRGRVISSLHIAVVNTDYLDALSHLP